jgi:hypothetical protein
LTKKFYPKVWFTTPPSGRRETFFHRIFIVRLLAGGGYLHARTAADMDTLLLRGNQKVLAGRISKPQVCSPAKMCGGFSWE